MGFSRLRRQLSRERLTRWWALCTALFAAGCQSTLQTLPADVASHRELEDVPFFAQAEYQCGPAALATVLRYAGVDVTPEVLVPMVYLPGRKGSLRTELSAATRRFDRIPYLLPGTLRALLREVQAGHPVLVLQNLGLRHWPQWHFAVVVGFDRERQQIVLRSGTQQRAVSSVRSFLRTWERSGAWSMVALRPNELPADPERERYLTAAAGLEAIGRLDTAGEAYTTAHAAWPDSAWPLLGLANVAYLRKQYDAAEALYRQVVAREPENLTARYNLADTLVQRGCLALARHELRAALATQVTTSVRPRLQSLLEELESRSAADGPGCACTGAGC